MAAWKVSLVVLFVAGGVIALLLARRELTRDAADPSVRALRELGAIQMGLERYRLDTGGYPTTKEGLGALVARPYTLDSEDWRGPYLESKERDLLRDPWGRPYLYRVLKNGRGMAYTLGADGKPGGSGEDRDIMSIAEVVREAEESGRKSGSPTAPSPGPRSTQEAR
jgi:general secretion pathway protein G